MLPVHVGILATTRLPVHAKTVLQMSWALMILFSFILLPSQTSHVMKETGPTVCEKEAGRVPRTQPPPPDTTVAEVGRLPLPLSNSSTSNVWL